MLVHPLQSFNLLFHFHLQEIQVHFDVPQGFDTMIAQETVQSLQLTNMWTIVFLVQNEELS